MELVEHYSSTEQLTAAVPLAPRAGHTQYTPRFVIRKVGPVDLRKGDYVRTFASEQIDNENADAGDKWYEGDLQDVILSNELTAKGWKASIEKVYRQLNVDPRWTLWVGVNIGVRRAKADGTNEATVIRERGTNWDNWTHHWNWHDSEARTVSADAPAQYFYTTVWFDTNPAYRLAGAYMEIVDRGRIEVEVFR